jgi:hypothetical protein
VRHPDFFGAERNAVAGISNAPAIPLEKCPVPDCSSVNDHQNLHLISWFNKIKTQVEQEKINCMNEYLPGIIKEEGKFKHCPGITERIKSLVADFLGSLARLMGKKERCAYDGFSGSCSAIRAAIPGIKMLSDSNGLDIFSLIMACAYVLTTSTNGALAAARMASLFQSEGSNFCWILNNLNELERIVQRLHAGDAITFEEAKLFNELMRKKDGISFLKNCGADTEQSAESATGREWLGMIPRALNSLVQGIKKIAKALPVISEALGIVQGANQLIAGPLDIRQACADARILCRQESEYKKASEILHDHSEDMDQASLYFARDSLEGRLEQARNALTMTDIRLSRGSILTASGIATIASNIVLWLKKAHVLHMVGITAGVAAIGVALKIVTGIVLAAFLLAACWFGYLGYVAGKKMAAEMREARRLLQEKVPVDESSPNRYLQLHRLVSSLVQEWSARGKSLSSTAELSSAEKLFGALGMHHYHLHCLLLEADGKADQLEWLKERLAPLFGLDYIREAEPAARPEAVKIASLSTKPASPGPLLAFPFPECEFSGLFFGRG